MSSHDDDSPQLSESALDALREGFGLRMDALGRFWRNDEVFEHPRIVDFLRRHIEFENGRFVVRIGDQWVYIDVEDQPLRVRSVSAATRNGHAHPQLLLDDGRTPWLDASTLRCDAKGQLECTVTSASGASQLGARFLNTAALAMTDWIEGLDTVHPQIRYCDPTLDPEDPRRISAPVEPLIALHRADI